MELRAGPDVSRRMSILARIALASTLVVLMALTLTPPAAARPVVTPPYMRLPANARALCSEHVTGTDMHIIWRSYAVPDSPAQIVTFFANVGVTLVPEGDGFVASPNASDRLMVYPANGSYPTCARRPRRSERTVIIRSSRLQAGPSF